jgi:hypothetical protein
MTDWPTIRSPGYLQSWSRQTLTPRRILVRDYYEGCEANHGRADLFVVADSSGWRGITPYMVLHYKLPNNVDILSSDLVPMRACNDT